MLHPSEHTVGADIIKPPATAFDALERAVMSRRQMRRIGWTLLQATVTVFLVSLFFFRVPQVEGRSMFPTIEAGDHVLISTLAYGVTRGRWVLTRTLIRRGDIIAFERGQGDESTVLLKRVVGLPGELISIRNGIVEINGLRVSEPHAVLGDHSNLRPIVVPAGSVFVLGDNRAESEDSREFGPVTQASIIGKALLIIWPVANASRVR